MKGGMSEWGLLSQLISEQSHNYGLGKSEHIFFLLFALFFL